MRRIMVLLVIVDLIYAKPTFHPLPRLNPVMRYRLNSQPVDERPSSNLRPVRATPLARSGRNCFFSPVQCRLPVNQVRSMDTTRQRLFLNDQSGLGMFDRIRRWNGY